MKRPQTLASAGSVSMAENSAESYMDLSVSNCDEMLVAIKNGLPVFYQSVSEFIPNKQTPSSHFSFGTGFKKRNIKY